VMEAAQAAAQQYLDNIAQMERETAERCEKMLSDARQEAERILQGAQYPPQSAEPDQALTNGVCVPLDEN